MRLPLDAYDGYTDKDNVARLLRAVTAIEQTCMRSRGLSLPAGLSEQFLPAEPPALAFYGVANTADASTYGYRMPDEGPAPAGANDPTITPQVNDAFYGGETGAGGCGRQAFDALGISLANDDFAYIQGLRSQAMTEVYQDGHVVAANRAWSECMRTKGYVYPSPLAPARDRALLGRGLPVPVGAELPPPSPAEKDAAVSDVRCKLTVGYLRTFAVAAAGYQRRLIEREGQRLQKVREDWQHLLHTVDMALSDQH